MVSGKAKENGGNDNVSPKGGHSIIGFIKSISTLSKGNLVTYNIMRNGGDILWNIQDGKHTLQDYIASPANTYTLIPTSPPQSIPSYIHKKYLQRFGTITAKPTLTTQE